jgi:CheY-like chemotaxis protein
MTHAHRAERASDGPTSKHVIVVDDEPEIRLLTSRMLSRDYVVHDTASGEEVLELLAEYDVAAVLLNLRMPAPWTGMHTMQTIREQYPALEAPVIAFTAHALPGDRETLLEAGFDAYLAKPFVRSDLLDLLEAHIPSS